MGELFDRSVSTLVESWAHLASGSPGAEVIESGGAATAIFTRPPERGVLNNAVVRMGDAGVDATLDAIERAYEDHGVERYAVWVHESDTAAAAAVRSRGYVFDSSTRTMAMSVEELGGSDESGLDVREPGLEEFWRLVGVEGMVPELPREQAAHFYVARLDGADAATLMAFDHDGDCGIYMVGTRPDFRRRGLATALSAHAIHEAAKRGCTTASLQATEMAEGVYATVGFRDLGRFDEYVPPP